MSLSHVIYDFYVPVSNLFTICMRSSCSFLNQFQIRNVHKIDQFSATWGKYRNTYSYLTQLKDAMINHVQTWSQANILQQSNSIRQSHSISFKFTVQEIQWYSVNEQFHFINFNFAQNGVGLNPPHEIGDIYAVIFLAQRCLYNRSSVNLAFLSNICQPQAMYPSR